MTETDGRSETEPRRRKSMRLRGFDYSAPGAYFITICTHQRRSLFGQVADGSMVLNQFGHIVEEEWLRLPERFPSVEVGEYIVMPDHFHGILWIIDPILGKDNSSNRDVEAGFTPALSGQPREMPSTGQPRGLPSTGQPRGLPLLGQVIGAFKSLCVKGCLAVANNRNETLGKLWQRNYYEHIVRDEKELQSITLYI